MDDVTIFEVELEQEKEKTQKIAQVAARGASIAAELGHDLAAVQAFLRHYFRHVDAVDVDERSVANPPRSRGEPLPSSDAPPPSAR
jgi:hypothetical protein